MKYTLVLLNKTSTVHIRQANKVVQLVETLTLNARVCTRIDTLFNAIVLVKLGGR